MTGFSPDQLSVDGFLGGRLSVSQPRAGYRAATDPVLLAAAVPAKSGETILELGCGVGVALLCLQARVQNLTLWGVEIQANYADLARQNARQNAGQNKADIRIVSGDLETLPSELRAQSFDHVMANPPFMLADQGSHSNNDGRETALREATPLDVWIKVAAKRLKPKGYLSMIHLAERLPDILRAFDTRLGSVEVKPLVARSGQYAGRVLVRARKTGRAAFRLHSPLVIHKGPSHMTDGDDYRDEIRDILRDGGPLVF